MYNVYYTYVQCAIYIVHCTAGITKSFQQNTIIVSNTTMYIVYCIVRIVYMQDCTENINYKLVTACTELNVMIFYSEFGTFYDIYSKCNFM